MTLPAREMLGVGRQHDFDRCTALSSCRVQHFFDEQIGDLLAIEVWSDNHHIDRPDESAGPDRWPQSQDCTADHLMVRLGYRDTRVRQVDQLAQQAYRVDWGLATGHGPFFRA